jgi:hypothetical protein
MELTTHSHSRSQYQSTVDQLLAELDERRRHLYRLQAAGVQRAGMRDLKRDLQAVRAQLRDAVSHVM